MINRSSLSSGQALQSGTHPLDAILKSHGKENIQRELRALCKNSFLRQTVLILTLSQENKRLDMR